MTKENETCTKVPGCTRPRGHVGRNIDGDGKWIRREKPGRGFTAADVDDGSSPGEPTAENDRLSATVAEIASRLGIASVPMPGNDPGGILYLNGDKKVFVTYYGHVRSVHFELGEAARIV